MADQDYEYTGLQVAIRRVAAGLTDEEQARAAIVEPAPGYFEFGVVIDGVFVSFAARKAGDIDLALLEARETAARQPAPASESSASSSSTAAPASGDQASSSSEPSSSSSSTGDQPAGDQPPTAAS